MQIISALAAPTQKIAFALHQHIYIYGKLICVSAWKYIYRVFKNHLRTARTIRDNVIHSGYFEKHDLIKQELG